MHQQQLKCVWKDQINFHLKLLIKFKLKFTLNIPVSCLVTSIVIYIGLVYIQTIRKHTIDRQQLDLHSREVKRSIDTRSKGAKTGSIFFQRVRRGCGMLPKPIIKSSTCMRHKKVSILKIHKRKRGRAEKDCKNSTRIPSFQTWSYIFWCIFHKHTPKFNHDAQNKYNEAHIQKWAFRDKNVVVIMKTF